MSAGEGQGMGGARERLDWRGKHVVTIPEEAAGMNLGTGWRMTQRWRA